MGWGRKFLLHTRLFVHSGFCTNAQLLPIQKHSTFLKMVARIIVHWPLERGVWPHKKPSHHLVPPLLWGLTLSFGAGGALVWPWGVWWSLTPVASVSSRVPPAWRTDVTHVHLHTPRRAAGSLPRQVGGSGALCDMAQVRPQTRHISQP